MALSEVLRWGVSAASSAVSTEATELCDRTSFEAILSQCPPRQL
jgi:fructose-1-phosphate kinase PfkB-like protein